MERLQKLKNMIKKMSEVSDGADIASIQEDWKESLEDWKQTQIAKKTIKTNQHTKT